MSDNDNDLYKYDPSKGIAIVFTIIFSALTALHTYQLFRTRTWYFIAFVVGAFCESIGYIIRIVSIDEKPDYTVGSYAMTQVLVLIAPSLFAASMYMELGRIIRLTGGEAYALVRINWLTKIFVIGDVFAFFLQGGGSGLLASDSKKTVNTGKTILIVGLVVQIVFFALFVVTSTIFHFRITKHSTPKLRTAAAAFPWKKHLINVYSASVMILIRCIYRLIEYTEGDDGYLLTHEWTMYALDALLMVVVLILFAIIHPSEVRALLNGKGKVVRNVFFIKELVVDRSGAEIGYEEMENLHA